MQDITYLVGRVLCDRTFRQWGIDEAVRMAPYGDLTAEQEQAFREAWADPGLRDAVEAVWAAYDRGRAEGAISEASPWYD